MDAKLEHFYEKWLALKPKNLNECTLAQAKEEYKNLINWQEKWVEIKNSVIELTKNCTLSNIDPYTNINIHKIEEELNAINASWGVFKEFYEGLSDMEKEDWLVFRKKLTIFQDFILQWNEKVASKQDYVFEYIHTIL